MGLGVGLGQIGLEICLKTYHSSVGGLRNVYALEIPFESRGIKLYEGENES
jgi:hypothetical protein